MDDVTQLADLAEDQGDNRKTSQLPTADVNYSESESESIDQEYNDSVVLEKLPHKDGQYQHIFNFNKSCYRCIVGFKGEALERLCNETKTIIRVSKKKKRVVIIGSVQKRIIHAKHKITKIIENSKNKVQYTHFISIPTNTDSIKENFNKFKKSVMKNCDTKTTGFNEGIFQKPEKLHLTICMLHLLDETDQQRAIETLNSCKTEIIDPIINANGPMTIEFKGLKCMGNNPTKARILFIDVHEKTGFLQKMSDAISDYFICKGLSRKEHENVTLHMTVINTVYLKNKKLLTKRNFDATSILKDHQSTHMGKINLSTFHLSKLTEKSADGYFKATSKINF